MMVTIHWDVDGGGVLENIDLAPPSVMEVPDDVEHDDVANWLSDQTGFFVFTWQEVRH